MQRNAYESFMYSGVFSDSEFNDSLAKQIGYRSNVQVFTGGISIFDHCTRYFSYMQNLHLFVEDVLLLNHDKSAVHFFTE